MMETKKAIDRLIDIIGRDKVFPDEGYLSAYSYDSTNIFLKPDVVVFPTCEGDVINILKTASEFSLPVVARGAGTSRSGGPLATRGGILISFTRMNRIKEIDRVNMCAVVEPGVVTSDLNEEAKRFGLYYPPDPSSFRVSTIGGNISHNAGGIHAVKYGVTKNYLLGMRVVLMDGSLVLLGGRVMKSVVGYDLMRLICGSEGTLAVITEATLRLIPRPECKALVVIPFEREYEWIETIQHILQSGVLPCSIEYMDSMCISANKRVSEYAIFNKQKIESIVFVELDGNRKSVEFEIEKIKGILNLNNRKDYLSSLDTSEIERFWDIRRDISPSLNSVGRYRIADDVSIPLSNLKPAMIELKDFAKENGYRIAVFGHAGDSNLHINYLFDSQSDMEQHFEKIMDRISEVVLRYNGSISGEHGIGILKRNYSEKELDANAIRLMKEIKKIFDPKGLLNPGKIFK